MQQETSVIKLDINLIVPNKYQPRKVFDIGALTTLAESIGNYGILNPILVRKKDDKYEIIAGERRFRAAKLIGLKEVPVLVKDANEQQMAELALIENLEREELNALEEAKAYEEIMRIGNQTQESLAQKLGKSQSAIANKIRLLSLPIEVQDALSQQKISERHARSLLKEKDKEKQIKLLNRIISERLTVKETERLINEKEFDEKEIQKAINDIMKSISMVELEETNVNNEKEEKEDDNMNNGNFFPNFDNNTMNNTSLNMMNMQSMNQAPMGPTNETVMPTMNQPMENPGMTMNQDMNMTPELPGMNNFMSPEPMMAPQMNVDSNPIPEFNPYNQEAPMNQGMNMTPELPGMNNFMSPEPMMAPQMNMDSNPIPEFNPYNQEAPMNPGMNMTPELPGMNNFMSSEPMMAPQVNEPVNNNSMMDQPLFNPDVVIPSINESFNEPMAPVENIGFDTPVVMGQEPMMAAPTVTEINQPSGDKVSELVGFLTNNGYNFKTLNNASEDCIIIEIPKNY